MDNTQIFIDIGDVANSLVDFIGSDDYNRILNSTYGSTKEDGFKSALMIAPLIILSNCKKYMSKSGKSEKQEEG